jgi:hypothetical protein
MTYAPRSPSILQLLTRWRSSLDGEPRGLADALRGEAERCFRLAQGIASFELADELETIGRAFESEAEELEAAPQGIGSSVSRRSSMSPPQSRAA